MTKKDKNDWRKWWYFMGRRMRESAFLASWIGMAWTLDVYIISSFPVNGPPKYMLLTFEYLFDISTLLELISLLFWPYWTPTAVWLRKRFNLKDQHSDDITK